MAISLLAVSNLNYAIELGLLVDDHGTIAPANPIYTETIGRYLTRGTQDTILSETKENVWVKDGKLDMPALMAACAAVPYQAPQSVMGVVYYPPYHGRHHH